MSNLLTTFFFLIYCMKQGAKGNVFVLDLAEIKLTSFIATYMVLCFAILAKRALIT